MKRKLVASFAGCALSLLITQPLIASPSDNTLRIAAPWEVGALTPSAGTALQRMGVTETLTRPDVDGTIQGLLAESWTANEDLTEWRFRIRKGVSFHDGTALTAAVVADNLNRYRAENALRNAPIDEIRAADDEVVFVLERPFSPMPAYLSDWSTGILAAVNLGQDAVQVPYGTGYYRAADVSDPSVLKLTAHDSYWGDQPEIANAEYHFVPDAQTRQAMISAGEVELAFGLAATAVQTLKNAENLQVHTQALPRIRALKLNLGMPPYDEIDVRRAISLAIDRKGIARAIVGNESSAATQLIPPGIAGWHDPKLAEFRFDPAEAAELLGKAGWTKDGDGFLRRDGVRFEMELRTYDSRPELPMIGIAVQDMLKQVGIDVRIRSGDWSVISDGQSDGTLEAGIVSDTFVYVPDPIGAIAENFYRDGGDWGAMNWHNAAFDALVEEYEQSTDPEVLNELRTRMVAQIHEDLPLVTITWYDEIYAVSNTVDGFRYDVYELRYGLNELSWRE
jgi:peptide/nickel transport system substrate-binding protein